MTPHQHTVPTLAFCGSTGAGKSSLINALMRAQVRQVGVTPTTREAQTHEATLDSGIPVYLMDTPGLGEAARHEEYSAALLKILPRAAALVWVAGYDNRALDMDVRVLRRAREAHPEKPVLILGNAVDRASRAFDPKTFNADAGSSAQERAVGQWLRYLRQTFADVRPAGVLPCAAGEGGNHTERQYNLAAVSHCIESLLPAAQRARWLECERALRDKSLKGDKIVLAATATAGTIGLAPLPMADMPFIVATQAGMALALCRLHGRALSADTARSLSLAALSAVAGPLVFQTLCKLIPGLGSAIGAGVAAACTFAVGKVTQHILETGQQFEVNHFKDAVREAYKQRRQENHHP